MGISRNHKMAGDASARVRSVREWVRQRIDLGAREDASGAYYLFGDRVGKIVAGLTVGFQDGSWYISVPPLNVGSYRIFRKAAAGGVSTADEEWCRLKVEPYKITEEQLHIMLGQVQSTLPLRIADRISRLQTQGEAPVPLSGIALWHGKPPDKKTFGKTAVALAACEFQPGRLANIWRQELAFLKTMLEGTEDRKNPGFLKILATLRSRYLRNLHPRAVPVPAYRLRRPDAANLKKACRVDNLFQSSDGSLIFKKIEDRRVDLHPDIHENRVIRLVHDLLAARLASLLRNFKAQAESGAPGTDALKALEAQARRLCNELARARAAAPFLDRVGGLKILPPKVTVALRKIAPYKSALDILGALNQHLLFSLNKDNLEYFLDNTPALYQKWCSLLVMDSVLETLIKLKKDFAKQHPENKMQIKYINTCFKKNKTLLFMDLLSKDNNILRIEIVYNTRVLEILLTLERNFIGISSSKDFCLEDTRAIYRSLSFDKRPDICLEIKTRHESPSDLATGKLLLFDPKYKKYSENPHNKNSREQKSDCARNDIDKMHAYRDSIVKEPRPGEPQPCVEFAAILHPCDFLGKDRAREVDYYTFGRLGGVPEPEDPRHRRGVGAVRCVPQDGESCRSGIDKIVYAFLAAELGRK